MSATRFLPTGKTGIYRRYTAVFAIVALVLGGCVSSRPESGALVSVAAPAAGASTYPIYIATTRARDQRAGTLFSGERAEQVGYAKLELSVPPTHKPGKIEWPSSRRSDPARYIVTRSGSYLADDTVFRDELHRELAARPAGSRDVLIFVHGYNTLFAEGVYRITQIVHDSGFDGVPVLFTWASRGSAVDYVYDRDSATAARDALEQAIDTAAKSGADRVHILAHSMGNWVTVEALRQAKIGGNGNFGGKLGQVVLASPDIDVDVFKTQMRRLGKPQTPFTILVSTDDRALTASSILAGDKPRVGGYVGDKEFAELGVSVIDLTDVEADDSLNHGKFAAAPEIVRLIGNRLKAGDALTVKETGLGNKIGNFGRHLGGLIGATADLAIATPVGILQAPVKIIQATSPSGN